MITIKKLGTLKPGTRRRKTAVLLQAFENDLLLGKNIDRRYFLQLLDIIENEFPDTDIPSASAGVRAGLQGEDDELLVFMANNLRHRILKVLGTEPADWDMARCNSPVIPDGQNNAKHFEVFLDDLRSPFNVGSIFRTAEAFGVSRIILSPDCPSPEHKRAQRSSMGCTEIVPWCRASKDEIFTGEEANNENIFALELGGTAINDFIFPESGTVIIGSEELGISPEARKAAEKSLGLVSIPVSGLKGSINVSVAFGIMMQRWFESLAAAG